MRARPFGRAAVVVAVAAAAATLLTSCRSNVGAAAKVNGERIGESTVNGYVDPAGPNPSAAAQVQQEGVTTLPDAKPFVLQFLVGTSLLEHTLAAHGGVPSAGQLAAERDTVSQSVLQYYPVARAAGAATSFKRVLERFFELDVVLQKRLPSTSSIVAAIQAAGARVSINPRYGTWIPKQLAVRFSTKAGIPDYLRLQPTPAGSAGAGLPAP